MIARRTRDINNQRASHLLYSQKDLTEVTHVFYSCVFTVPVTNKISTLPTRGTLLRTWLITSVVLGNSHDGSASKERELLSLRQDIVNEIGKRDQYSSTPCCEMMLLVH